MIFGIDNIYLLLVAIFSWFILIGMIGGVFYEGINSSSTLLSFNSINIDINKDVGYKCTKAVNLKTGTDCSFDKEQDAANWCHNDPACIGYVFKDNLYNPSTNIVLNSISGGEFHAKRSFISPLYSYINNYTDNNNNKGDYTCSTALNQWVDANKKVDPNWCRFNNTQDAANWCTNDSKCKGYIVDDSVSNNIINPILANQNITYIASSDLKYNVDNDTNKKNQKISYTKQSLK